jgi:hypothetical protein
MTSAVPYDPDDFDNNPFAESSIVSPTAYQQQDENAHSNVDGNANSGEDDDHDHGGTATDEGSNTTSGTANSLSEATNRTLQDSESGSPPDSIFNDYPTEVDFKRYLPERLQKNETQIIIKIQEIEANGSNTQRNPIFKFNSKVIKLSGYRKEVYRNVRRTYKEIESLYKYLIYNNIEVFVPALPTVTSLFTPMSPEFITSVTNSFQDWFNRVCKNPILIRNKEFALFFEQNDFGYVSSKTKPSSNSVIATGLKRKTLKQFSPPYDSCDYLARYRPMIKEVYLNCQKILEKLEKYLKYQRQSAFYTNEFINLFGDMAEMEASSDMAKVWKKFTKFSLMFNEVDLIKSASFISELIRFFKQVSDDSYNIKESLTNRHLLMRELINAEEATKKKHSTITKLKMKSTIDPLKVDEAIRSLELCDKHEKELKYQVKRTTYEMLIEAKEYLDYMSVSARRLFKILAKQQILQERRKLNLLMNNKLINQQESLGRLGREDLPETIKPPKTSRQDSWSSRTQKSYTDNESRTVSNGKDDLNEEIANVDAKSAASLLAGSRF